MSLVSNLNWWFLRFSALLTVPSFLLDLEIFFLIQAFIFLHVKLGLRSIIVDYAHNKKVVLLFLILIRFLSIGLMRCILEFIL